MVLPYANTSAMLKHLEAISQSVPEDRHAVLILDQAPWHITSKVKIFENLTLISLPPASRQLNPAEQVWQQLRDNWLANRCFKNYEEIVNSCCEAWNWFVDIPEKVRQLCSRKWCKIDFLRN